MKEKIIINIELLKKKKRAIILAHYYTDSKIQDIADFTGDSLALAQFAQKSKAEIIVFAGVHFMAETAKILNPNTKVLVPDFNAGCSLSDSCKSSDFEYFKKNNPNHKVITYINSSIEVKMLSDVICTSSNAVKIVNSFDKNQKLIFAPDKNLGNYINNLTGRNMLLWNGSCHVHNQLNIDAIIKLKIQHPEAKVIAHPECQDIILKLADFIGSTKDMLNFTKNDKSNSFIVATETGILHQMIQFSPTKQFYIVPADENCNCNDCIYMKMNTLNKINDCLENESNQLILTSNQINKARIPLQRMLDLS
jgi:quinolinate synthase